MFLTTVKDLAFVCSTIVSSINVGETTEHKVYNEQSKIVTIQKSKAAMQSDMFLGCMEIGIKSFNEGLEPEIGIALGWHESKFYRNVVSDVSKGQIPSIGMMQVIPRTWCKLEQQVESWKSKSQFFGDKVCDLERAGILAILSTKNQKGMKKNRVKILKEIVDRVLTSNEFDSELRENLEKNKHLSKWTSYTSTQKNNILTHYYSKKYESKNGRNLEHPLFLPFCHYNGGSVCRESSFAYANAIISKVEQIRKMMQPKFEKKMKNKEKQQENFNRFDLVSWALSFASL